MLNAAEIDQALQIFADDISRRPVSTREYYMSIARKFLTEYGDFSRRGIMSFMHNCGWCDNSLRTTHYVIEHLCMALSIPFPLNKNDLAPVPDEYDIHTPTRTLDEVEHLINYWKEYPGSYQTALLYLSTIYTVRAIEMTTAEITDSTVKIHVAKKHRDVVREHPIWNNGMIYLCGYEKLSKSMVKYTFHTICRRAGVQEDKGGDGFHSIRRAFTTEARARGVGETLLKRYTHWSINRSDIVDVYTHMSFDKVNEEMRKCHPFLELW